MDLLNIRWEVTAGPPRHIVYFVDDSPVGQDDAGFDRVLDIIRSKNDVKVVLRISQPGSLGGDRLIDSIPFKDRFDELAALVGPGRLNCKFD